MRSVSMLLFDADTKAVEQHLDLNYTKAADSWLFYFDKDDPALYIFVLPRERHIEECYEDRTELRDLLQGREYLAVIADVSGRHPGDEQVLAFVESCLSAFHGFAVDDYTDHPWRLEEIRSRSMWDGHPFFDYKGWYERP
jgi:hypothetical protein